MTTRKIEKGRQKCHDYWPAKKGEIKVFQGSFLDNRNDQITVEFVDDQIKNNKAFSISLLKVTRKLKHVSSESNKNNCSFYLNHCWYTAWPDHGIPESSKEMIDFVFQVRKFDREVIGVWGCLKDFLFVSLYFFFKLIMIILFNPIFSRPQPQRRLSQKLRTKNLPRFLRLLLRHVNLRQHQPNQLQPHLRKQFIRKLAIRRRRSSHPCCLNKGTRN